MKRNASADLALLSGAIVLLFLLTPFGIEGDGAGRYDALSRLLSMGYFSGNPYSLIGPIFSTPLWIVGHLHGSEEWWVARFNLIVFVVGLCVMYWALVGEFDRRTSVRFLLVLTVASMFPHHDSRYYGEVFTAVLAATGLAVVVVRQRAWGWVLVVIGCANTPPALAGFALVSLWLMYEQRDLRKLIPLACGILLALGEAWIRRGSPFWTGYAGNRGYETVLTYSGRPGFSYPFVLGVLSIALSFGKGLLFFAPGLVMAALPASRTGRPLIMAWLLFLVGLVVVYSRWWSWYGGDFWGPRFFLFASIPAALALTSWLVGPRRSFAIELVGVVTLMWSTWVGVNGLVFGFETPEVCTANHYALEFLCWYTPEYSALFRPFIVPRSLGRDESILLGLFAVVGVYLVACRVARLMHHEDRALISAAPSRS